ITGRVEIWGYTGTIDHFIAAKDRLEEMYPGLEIVTQQFDYPTAHTNILNALTSGMGVPDLVNFDVNYVGDFAAGMTDISDRFAPYAEEFAPIAVQLASYGGKLCGLPQDNQPMGYAYRADIFEEYGITEDDLATWDGYIDAAKKLWMDSGETIKMISMDAPGSQMPVLGAPHQIHEVFLHLAGFPGVFFDKEDTHVVIDEPAAIAAIEKFQQICDPEVSYISQTTNASVAAYQSGLVASNICPAWWPLGLNNQLADQSGLWRIMRLPALEEGGLRAAFQIPTVTGIPTLAANPDAAWAILYEAQLTTEAQLRFNEVTGGIFVTNNDAVDILVERELPYFGGQKIYELFNEILADVPDVYFGRGWVEARSILTSGIEPIMRGEMTAEEGLTASAEEMRRRLNKE
ncbi:MAG: extracellular solute-binding protein, partial [Burkholderiales bacterium]|nr:extracellular solute-binding protein [Anaerolineae bacterium]